MPEAKTFDVLVADDHDLMRSALCSLVSSLPGFRTVAEAGDGAEIIEKVRDGHFDLVLMDLGMPRMDGITAIRELRRSHPAMRILALTVHNEDEYVMAALDAGVDGYILKDSSRQEFLKAIDAVLAGGKYLSPGISASVMRAYAARQSARGRDWPWERLTRREQEVFHLAASGTRNKDIAAKLFISVKTVEKHRKNLMAKLNVRSAAALRDLARRMGLIIPPGE